jgi:hypothetical protein
MSDKIPFHAGSEGNVLISEDTRQALMEIAKRDDPLHIQKTRKQWGDDDSTSGSLFTNLIMFILGGALVWALFSWTPINKRGTKLDAQNEEAIFKQGVEWGVNGAIFCANNGMTNIPRDELIQRAWAVRQGDKK